MRALATPMINYGKLDQGNWHLLHHDVLKNSHKRKLITRLKPNVVAEECVEQIEFIVFSLRVCHCELLSRTDIPVCHFHLSIKYTGGGEKKTGPATPAVRQEKVGSQQRKRGNLLKFCEKQAGGYPKWKRTSGAA